MIPPLNIPDFFKDKTILISGGTGFMGKILVEKLLWSCPDLKCIYLIIRNKNGSSSQERIKTLTNDPAFCRIANNYPERLYKVHFMAGDMLEPGLGLSDVDTQTLISTCQIVFHTAACVRFDKGLRDALNLNTGGTLRMLELSEKMQQIQVFLHVSTTYCRCSQSELEEKLYPCKVDPFKLMETVNWMDDDLLSLVEPKIIHPEPNTYAFTKQITENVIETFQGKFPIAIARPSIVTASYKEPVPGWVDNINGPTGLLIGAGKGVIRSMLIDENASANIIPVDLAANGCIILAAKTAYERSKEIQVCNVSNSPENNLTWGYAINKGRLYVDEFPFSVALWYPGGSCKTSKISHFVACLFLHLLPAYFIDAILFILGYKTIMRRIQKKVSHGLEILQYYSTKQWIFHNEKFLSLQNCLSFKDREDFCIDTKDIDWASYIRNYIRGTRLYCCKEKPETLRQARLLNRILYYADRGLKLVGCLLIVYFMFLVLKPYVANTISFSAINDDSSVQL